MAFAEAGKITKQSPRRTRVRWSGEKSQVLASTILHTDHQWVRKPIAMMGKLAVLAPDTNGPCVGAGKGSYKQRKGRGVTAGGVAWWWN